MHRRAGHAAAVGFLGSVDGLPNVDVATLDAKVEADAWRWLRQHDERLHSVRGRNHLRSDAQAPHTRGFGLRRGLHGRRFHRSPSSITQLHRTYSAEASKKIHPAQTCWISSRRPLFRKLTDTACRQVLDLRPQPIGSAIDGLLAAASSPSGCFSVESREQRVQGFSRGSGARSATHTRPKSSSNIHPLSSSIRDRGRDHQESFSERSRCDQSRQRPAGYRLFRAGLSCRRDREPRGAGRTTSRYKLVAGWIVVFPTMLPPATSGPVTLLERSLIKMRG